MVFYFCLFFSISLCFVCFYQASFVSGAGHTQACAKARFSANDERLLTIGMHDRSIFQWKVVLDGVADADAPGAEKGGKKGGKKKKGKKKKGK